MRSLSELPSSFRRHIEVQPDGCWLWTGGRNREGYGTWYGKDRHSALAHRHLFIALNGSTGHQVDHECHNRARETCPGGPTCPHRRCVNPDHLVAHTPRENVLGGNGLAAQHARQESCVHGHPFTPDNTGHRKTPHGTARVCRRCKANRERDRQAAKPAAWHAQQNAQHTERRRARRAS